MLRRTVLTCLGQPHVPQSHHRALQWGGGPLAHLWTPAAAVGSFTRRTRTQSSRCLEFKPFRFGDPVSSTPGRSIRKFSSKEDNGNQPLSPSSVSLARQAPRGNDWDRRKHRLLAMEAGSFKINQWRETEALLTIFFHRRENFARERIEDGFLLLDRLQREFVSGQIPQTELGDNTKEPLDVDILASVLVAWRNFLLFSPNASTTEASSSSTEEATGRVEEPETRSIKDLLKPWIDYIFMTPVSPDVSALPVDGSAFGGLDPDCVLQKIRLYHSSALFKSDVLHYNIILHVMAHLCDPQKVEHLVEWMGNQRDYQNLLPDASSYGQVLTAWRNNGNPEQCDRILRELIENRQLRKVQTTPEVIHPIHFVIAISAWSESTDPIAPRKATELFYLMQHLGHPPTREQFTALMMAWARSYDKDQSDHVQRLYVEMKDRWQKNGDTSVKPNGATINAILTSLSRSSDPAAVEKATSVFQEMAKFDVAPNSMLYNTMMTIFSRHNQPHRVEQLFQQMKENYANEGVLALRNECYTTRLQAWSKAGNPEKTAEVLAEMVMLHEKGELDQKPTTQGFNAVLKAWLLSKRPDTAVKAEMSLRQMFRFAKENAQFDCRPDVFSFTSVMASFVAMDPEGKGPSTMKRILSLFQQMKEMKIQPNTVTFNTIMSAWAKRNQPDRVEELFLEMKKGWEAGDQTLKPSCHSHGIRVQVWGKAGNPDMTSQALNDMIDMVEEGLLDEKPTTLTFNAVLSSWMRSGRPDAGEQAEMNLRQMIVFAQSGRFNCYPNTVSYNIVIGAWSRSKNKLAGEQALRLLEELKTLAMKHKGNKEFQPDIITYNNVVTSLAGFNIVDGETVVLSLLEDMQTMFRNSNKRSRDDLRRLLYIERCIKASPWASNRKVIAEIQRLGKSL